MEKKIITLKDLTPGMKNVYVNNVNVVETGEIQEKEKDGKKINFIIGKIIDDSISEPISISAWGFATGFLKDAKKINLINCFCKEYEGRLEISSGMFGKIEKVE